MTTVGVRTGEGAHNLERGEASLFIGGKRRLFRFNNRARRKLEELLGYGLAGLADETKYGFDFVTKLVRAGLVATEGDPGEDATDEWIDDLADNDDPDVGAGLVDSFNTVTKKLGAALSQSMSRTTTSEAKEEVKGGKTESPQVGTS